jgi:hypothetical protein
MTKLTRTQRRVIGEIDEISEELGLDHRVVVEEWEGSEFLTTMLGLIRDELIVSAIVHEYTFIDELLGSIITKYFFGSAGGRSAWRTRRFQRFNHFILERLYLLEKLALVRDIRPLPRAVVTYVQSVNDLRNAVAHAFFPENLRGERTSYRKLDVFTIEGFRALRADRDPTISLLMRRAYGVK